MGNESLALTRFGPHRRATRVIVGAATTLVLAAAGCSIQRITPVEVDSQLATLGSIEMQERLVILGIPGCADSEQLGVLINPNTVATTRRVAEAEDLIRATNMLGQVLPVDPPTSHSFENAIVDGPIVHYGLADPFEPGPEGIINARWGRSARSFTATIAWIANGELTTTTAHAHRGLSIEVDISRSKIGAENDVPAAVIEPAVGIIGWLGSEPTFGSPQKFPVRPIDSWAPGTSGAGTPDSSCPAAKLARAASDASVGGVDLPTLPPLTTMVTTTTTVTTTTLAPKADLPVSASFSPSTVTVDGVGKPCPTGELTVTLDSYEVTEPPITPDGAFSIALSITLTNDTTSAITIGELKIPYTTTSGPERMLLFGSTIAPGTSSTIVEDEFVLGRLVAFGTPDFETSILYFADQFDCTY